MINLIKEKEEQIKKLELELYDLKSKVDSGLELNKWYKKSDNTLFFKPTKIDGDRMFGIEVWLDAGRFAFLDEEGTYSNIMLNNMKMIETSHTEMSEHIKKHNDAILSKF